MSQWAGLALGLLISVVLASTSVGPGLSLQAQSDVYSSPISLPLVFRALMPPAAPTLSPTPLATAAPTGTISSTVRQEAIVISAYPYEPYLQNAYNPYYNMQYRKLNWGAYNKAPQIPVSRTLTTLVLENEYLRVTMLPELGGRIYECVFKPTGHDEFYRNPVLKPTSWGPPEQGWWLGLGGMEWCLPVAEHGYESGTPWTFETLQETDGVTVTVRDSAAADRLRAWIDITLPADRAYFLVRPHIENPTAWSVSYSFWLNAMLAPGGSNAPSSRLRFIMPTTQMTLHSRDQRWVGLPDPDGAFTWPQQAGRDLSLLGNWPYFLGCFERPSAVAGYMGVYDDQVGEGMIRVYPSNVARGAKVFSGGYGSNALSPALWTDDRSSYVELHGGVAPTFDDWATLAPHSRLSWTEYWYPVPAIGGVSFAGQDAALNLAVTPQGVSIGVATTSDRRAGSVSLRRRGDNQLLFQATIPLISPSRPYVAGPITADGLGPDQLTLSYIDSSGVVIATSRQSH